MTFQKTMNASKNDNNDIDAIFAEELERTGEVAPCCELQDFETEDCGDELIIHGNVVVEEEIQGDGENPFPAREAVRKNVTVRIDKTTGRGSVDFDDDY